jgi:hypothetical protein
VIGNARVFFQSPEALGVMEKQAAAKFHKINALIRE